METTAQVAETTEVKVERIGTIKGNKGGKLSRNKRKNGRKGSPISLFVKGKISGEDYFRLTGQTSNRRK